MAVTAIAVLVALCAWGSGLAMQLASEPSSRPWVWTASTTLSWTATLAFDLPYRADLYVVGGADFLLMYLVAACGGSFVGTQAAIELRAYDLND